MIRILPLFVALAWLAVAASAQSGDMSALDTTHYGKNPAAGHYLTTRGFTLYYETYGEGAPLLSWHVMRTPHQARRDPGPRGFGWMVTLESKKILLLSDNLPDW